MNLDPVASLENFCVALCKEPKCSEGRDTKYDLLGHVKCVINAGNKLSPLQSCLLPCVLNLNALQTCDATAIVSKLVQTCPNYDKKELCVSACACCGDDGQTLDACVNVCLSGNNAKPNVPVKIPLEDGKDLPGLKGINVPKGY